MGQGRSHEEKRVIQETPEVLGLNNPMDGWKQKRLRDKQVWRRRNQKFSSRHVHLQVLIQSQSGESDSWIYESENQGRDQSQDISFRAIFKGPEEE